MPVCVYCNNRTFVNEDALRQHLETSSMHPFCTPCNFNFLNEEAYVAHMRDRHPPTFDCMECNKTFRSPLSLEDHYRGSSVHPNCIRCGKGFKNKRLLDDHFSTQHLLVLCPCGPLTLFLDELDTHYLSSNMHPSCPLCDIGFKDELTYTKHWASVHTGALRVNLQATGGGHPFAVRVGASSKNMFSVVRKHMEEQEQKEVEKGRVSLEKLQQGLEKLEREMEQQRQGEMDQEWELVEDYNNCGRGPTRRYHPESALSRAHLCSVLNVPLDGIIDLTSFIDRGPLIASGGYGHVYKGRWKNVQKILVEDTNALPEIAVKVITLPVLEDELQKKKRLKKLKRELELWSALQHENILPLIGFACIDDDPNMPAFISPWMKDGCVLEFLKKNMSIPLVDFFRDIITGLDYLHRFNPEIVHGDLKAANVLVNHRQQACLCDFGLSRFAIDNTLWRTTAAQPVGTLRWMAPELLEGNESVPTRASDIYAYGMTCYEILYKKIPFEPIRNYPAVMIKIMAGHRPERDRSCRQNRIWELITRCWAQNVKERPSTKEVLLLLEPLYDPRYVDICSNGQKP